MYSNCSDNVSYLTDEAKLFVQWSEPEFWDPFGNDVFISSNFPATSALLPWGVHTVQFVAEKPSNGLRTECVFTVSVFREFFSIVVSVLLKA